MVVSKRETKADRERARADRFRADVAALYRLSDHDWNDWELDWQESQMRRRPGYVFSDKEHAILERMHRDATPFTAWDGWTVSELIKSAYAYRLDCGEGDQELLEKLHDRGARELRLREMKWLIGVCRHVAGVVLARFEADRFAA
jgi:hypothetical protein